MTTLIKALIASTLALGCMGSMTGSQKISTHHYDAVAGVLDTNPVFCGVLGKHLDINRITAVQGLSNSQCGTCLKITAGDKWVTVMALDKGGKGLDLNKNSFIHLFGEDTGVFDATWEPTDSSACAGVVSGGDYQLPGMKAMPISKPAEKVTEPKPEVKLEEKLVPKVEVKQAEIEEVKEEENKKTETKEVSPKKEDPKIPSSTTCSTQGAVRCANKSQLSICAYGVLFPITCPSGTECEESNGAAYCVNEKSKSSN